MMIHGLMFTASAMLLAIFGLYLFRRVGIRNVSCPLFLRTATITLMLLNGAIVFAAAMLLWSSYPALAQENQADGQNQQPARAQGNAGMRNQAVGAALAAGLAAIGAGIGVGLTGAAAIGAITERPEVLGRTLIFVGLAEGIAIYGLIIAFMLLTGALGGS